MLTKDLAIADYDKGHVLPDRLTRRSHAHYARYAQQMLQVYHHGRGLTRRELHRAVHAVFAEETMAKSMSPDLTNCRICGS